MIPERFAWEYPSRCMEMLSLMEPLAREKKLLGSFSLIVAASVFLIPYERMKAHHPLNRGSGRDRYSAIRRVERQRFLEAEFWKHRPQQDWRLSRIMNDVERTEAWLDEEDRHPMSPPSRNKIASKKVGDVLRVIRNALAHGNVVYLDEGGLETRGAKLRYLGFLSRYEEDEEQKKVSETYRVITTTEDGFLSFVKAWAAWLAETPTDGSFASSAKCT